MTDLSPKARALVEASRSALRPSTGDRDRIDSLLRQRLGPEAVPLGTDAGAGAGAGTGRFMGFAGARALFRVAIGVCVVAGGVALWALRPSAPMQAVSAPRASTPNAPLAEVPVVESESAPIELAAPTQPRISAPESPGSRKPDPFAQELALLGRATQQLHLGHAEQALKALEAHERRFPNGTLSEERRAARAQALCMLGRVLEGRVEQSTLVPRSPAAARAAEVCDSAAAGKRL